MGTACMNTTLWAAAMGGGRVGGASSPPCPPSAGGEAVGVNEKGKLSHTK